MYLEILSERIFFTSSIRLYNDKFILKDHIHSVIISDDIDIFDQCHIIVTNHYDKIKYYKDIMDSNLRKVIVSGVVLSENHVYYFKNIYIIKYNDIMKFNNSEEETMFLYSYFQDKFDYNHMYFKTFLLKYIMRFDHYIITTKKIWEKRLSIEDNNIMSKITHVKPSILNIIDIDNNTIIIDSNIKIISVDIDKNPMFIMNDSFENSINKRLAVITGMKDNNIFRIIILIDTNIPIDIYDGIKYFEKRTKEYLKNINQYDDLNVKLKEYTDNNTQSITS